MRFVMWAKSWFLRLQVFLRRELLILRFRARSFFLLQSQPPLAVPQKGTLEI